MKKTVFKVTLCVFGIYAVLTVLMSWPVVAGLNVRLAGQGGDPWQTLWRFESKAALLSHSDEAFTGAAWAAREFLGGGEPRLVNLSVWPWMPLHLLLGEPLAYNVVWLLSYVLAGLGMYLLVKWLIREYGIHYEELKTVQSVVVREGSPFLAGLMYMFLPYHVAHSFGHFGALQIQWLPFLLWAFLSCIVRPRVWKAVLVGLLFVLQAWSEHHYALWFAIFALLSVMYYRRSLQQLGRQLFMPAAVAAVLVIGAGAIPYWPTVRLAAQPASPLVLGDAQLVRFSTDLFSFVVPAPFHPLAGVLSTLLFHQFFTGNIAETTQYLGLLPLLFVLFFRDRVPQSQRRWWLAVAAVFFIISLGPRLHIVGRIFPMTMPYAIVAHWPVFSSIRTVGRAGVMVGAAMSILFGLAAAAQVRRAMNIVILSGVLLLEFLFFPVPTQSASLPAAYSLVSQRPGARLIELPAATNYDAASRALYGSLRHGKEVVGNFALERADGPAAVAEARSLPVLRQLLYMRTTHLLEEREEFFEQDAAETFADVARYLDVRTVLVHVDSLSTVQMQAVTTFFEGTLGVAPVVIDDVLVYELDPLPSGDGVFATRDAGWEHVGYDPARNSVFAEVSVEARLRLYNIRADVLPVTLQWQAAAADAGKLEVTAPIALQETAATDMRTITLQLPPGVTELVFRHSGDGVSVLQSPHMEAVKPET